MKTPRLPGLPTVIGLMLTAVIAAWLGISGPIDLAMLQNWQTLIAATVTAIGIVVAAVVAVRNVRRQIRINILSREEERIERLLPGLHDAYNLCDTMVKLTGYVSRFHGTIEFINSYGLGGKATTFTQDVDASLPLTDAATRRRVTNSLFYMYTRAGSAQATQAAITKNEAQVAKDWEPREYQKLQHETANLRKILEDQSKAFQGAIDKLGAEAAALDDEIALYNRRKPRIRREIEEFFRDDEE